MLPNHIKSLLGECIKSKRCMLDSALVALVAAVFFCLILPTQSYLACADLFPYDYSSLFWALIWRCVLVGLTLFVLLTFSYFRCRGLIHVLLLSLVVAAILESGPLAIGLPELNGDISGYQSLTRKIVDSSVLVLALILPFVFLKYIRQYAGWISVALLFYSSVSLLDVKQPDAGFGSRAALCPLTPRAEVFRNCQFSTTKNTILLILDSISVNAARDVFSRHPEMKDSFPGFVNYENNLGMQWYTQLAVPAIMTGRFLENSYELASYSTSPFEKGSLIEPFVVDNLPVYVQIGSSQNGLTTRGQVVEKSRRKMTPLTEKMPGMYSFSVIDLSIFRILPYCLKTKYAAQEQFMPKEEKATDGVSFSDRDEKIWQMLSHPVMSSEKDALHVYHSLGGHYPIDRDENGRHVNLTKPSYDDYLGKCIWALRQLASMFEAWRRAGIYDVSTIIITGDHGMNIGKPGCEVRDVPFEAFPFLMVKAAHDGSPFSSSDVPTSHLKLHSLVTAQKERNMSRDEIRDILRCEERHCRKIADGTIVDWYVLSNRTVRIKKEKEPQRSLKSLRPLSLDEKYSFHTLDNKCAYLDYIASAGNRGASGGLQFSDSTEIALRLPDPGMVVDLEFTVSIASKEDVANGLVAQCGEVVAMTDGQPLARIRSRIDLKGVMVAEDGLVRVKFSRLNRHKVVLYVSHVVARRSKANDFTDLGRDKSSSLEFPQLDSSVGESCVELPHDKFLEYLLGVGDERYVFISGALRSAELSSEKKKTGLVLFNFYDKEGNQLRSESHYAYSEKFGAQFFYLSASPRPVGFKSNIRVPTDAVAIKVRVGHFYNQLHLELQDFKCVLK